MGVRGLEKLRENPGLENELSLHPYLKNSPLNIRDALYGGRTEATKTITESSRGRKSTMWKLLTCIPTFVNMGRILLVTQGYVGANCPPKIGRGLSNVRFYLPGNYNSVLPYKCNSKLVFPCALFVPAQ